MPIIAPGGRGLVLAGGASSLRRELVYAYFLEDAGGTRFDSGPYAQDLTETPTVGQAAGKRGFAADFPGNGPRLARQSEERLQIPDATSYAWSLWFNLDASESDENNPMVTKYDPVGEKEYVLGLESNDAGPPRTYVPTIRLYRTNSLVVTLQPVALAREFSGWQGWHHWAAWYDAGVKTLYQQLDQGTIYSAVATDHPSPAAASPQFNLGAYALGALGEIDGRMDEVFAWRRTLSAREGALLFAGARP